MNDLKKRIAVLVARTEAHHDALLKHNVNFEVWEKEEAELDAEREAIDKAAGKGLAVGRTLAFGAADGSAFYIVTKVRKNDVIVEWLPLGDAYRSPAVGLTADRHNYCVLRTTAEAYAGFPL